MKTAILLSLAAAAVSAQAASHKPAVPVAFRRFRIPPSASLQFLASEEGRAYLQATGHPLAKPAIRAFGAPPKSTVVPQAWLNYSTASTEPAEPATSGCNASTGTRFNLEPRANAVPQNQASADFLYNRVGTNFDLIVQAANDWRGNLTSGVRWDQSVSGYYVHRSAAADCSVQFEGGLPSFAAQGNTEMGTGNVVVAADPARDAFYMADVRFGSASTGGVGLFRTSAAALLNPSVCANGTHTAAQATACWAPATPPVLIFAQPVFDSVNDLPSIAVDQRASGSGAGNVYVAVEQFDFSSYSSGIDLVSCNAALSCSPAVSVSGSITAGGFPYVLVRPDGLITVSYVNANSDGSQDIFFVTCTAGSAPAAPVCGTPVQVTHVAQPIAPNVNGSALININLLAWTFPKHTSRAESGGSFTSFLAYEDCKNPYQYGNPPVNVCLNAEILLTSSTDGGKTWSTPASADTSTGHHFYPALATDASTGIVHLVYYSTTGDKFNHEVRVLRNQIAPGGTVLGSPKQVTKILDPIDGDPQALGSFQSDLFMGAVARGNGTTGQSRLYTSFDSTTVPGTYEGRPNPEQNNHIGVIVY